MVSRLPRYRIDTDIGKVLLHPIPTVLRVGVFLGVPFVVVDARHGRVLSVDPTWPLPHPRTMDRGRLKVLFDNADDDDLTFQARPMPP